MSRRGREHLTWAGAYARVGDKEKAFEWLEKSYEQKVGDITLIKYLPDFKSLRGDPRFSALLKHRLARSAKQSRRDQSFFSGV